MEHFIDSLHQAATEGRPCVLCIITEASGSVPGRTGAKMLVFPDGKIQGTIGGGTIEYQVIQDALALFSSKAPVTRKYNLDEDLGMQCGGSVTVYLETFGLRNHVFIFGGGHVGKAVASLAIKVGFTVTVVDERREIAESWNIPGVKLEIVNYLHWIESSGFDENSYIVIVTPKHDHDEKVLAACIGKKYAYIGMIGSRKKVAGIRSSLLEKKIAGEELVSGVDMPIGVPIAAETPEEIAVSIVARLIDVKNTRNKP